MKFYTTKSEVNCGPASFFNLIGIKGDKKLENKLSDIGRLKPFYASDYVSFLIWAKKFDLNVLVFVGAKGISKKSLALMRKYEKVPKPKWHSFEKKAISRHTTCDRKFSKSIFLLKSTAKKIDELLDTQHRVAVLLADFYSHPKDPVPHWVVAFKKYNNKYYIIDSSEKKIVVLPKKVLQKAIKMNNKFGFCAQLVAYKK